MLGELHGKHNLQISIHTLTLGEGEKKKIREGKGKTVSFSKQGCGKAQTASPDTGARMQRCCFFHEQSRDFAVASI